MSDTRLILMDWLAQLKRYRGLKRALSLAKQSRRSVMNALFRGVVFVLACAVAVSGAVPVYILTFGWTDAPSVIRNAVALRDLLWIDVALRRL